MKIEIENYRGFEIYFDTDCEKFQCILTEERSKESHSYSAIKKFVDDYKKENQGFKPFKAIPNIDGWAKKNPIKVIGIRKDGRFVAEQGEDKIQVGDYSLNDYILDLPENEECLKILSQLKSEMEEYRSAYESRRKEVISKMKIVTLKEYKKTLFP